MAFAKKMMEFPSDLDSFSTELSSKIHEKIRAIHFINFLPLARYEPAKPNASELIKYKKLKNHEEKEHFARDQHQLGKKLLKSILQWDIQISMKWVISYYALAIKIYWLSSQNHNLLNFLRQIWS